MADVRHSTICIRDASSPDSLTPPNPTPVASCRRPHRQPAVDRVWHASSSPILPTKLQGESTHETGETLRSPRPATTARVTPERLGALSTILAGPRFAP